MLAGHNRKQQSSRLPLPKMLCLFCGCGIVTARHVVISIGRIHERCWRSKPYRERLALLRELESKQ